MIYIFTFGGVYLAFKPHTGLQIDGYQKRLPEGAVSVRAVDRRERVEGRRGLIEEELIDQAFHWHRGRDFQRRHVDRYEGGPVNVP